MSKLTFYQESCYSLQNFLSNDFILAEQAEVCIGFDRSLIKGEFSINWKSVKTKKPVKNYLTGNYDNQQHDKKWWYELPAGSKFSLLSKRLVK